MDSGSVNMYDNCLTFYSPKSLTLADDAQEELWERINARLKGFCGDLARELSAEYLVTITASVGPDMIGPDVDPGTGT